MFRHWCDRTMFMFCSTFTLTFIVLTLVSFGGFYICLLLQSQMGHLDFPRRGVARAKVVGIFVCMVGAYNASYSTKYLLVRHLGHKHDLAT